MGKSFAVTNVYSTYILYAALHWQLSDVIEIVLVFFHDIWIQKDFIFLDGED